MHRQRCDLAQDELFFSPKPIWKKNNAERKVLPRGGDPGSAALAFPGRLLMCQYDRSVAHFTGRKQFGSDLVSTGRLPELDQLPAEDFCSRMEWHGRLARSKEGNFVPLNGPRYTG